MNGPSTRLCELLIVSGVAVGLMRVALLGLEPSPLFLNCFKDAAHICMGAIGLVAWSNSGVLRWLFWALCVVEVGCAVVSRL
jgi:hypothetical protein